MTIIKNSLQLCAAKVIPEKVDIPATLLHNFNLGAIMGDSIMKRIKLTQEKFTTVDDGDYERLKKLKWHVVKHHTGKFYAVHSYVDENGQRRSLPMARFLLGLQKGDKREADHVNRNSLDNQKRCNLRIVSRGQNQQNKAPHCRAASKYKGVWRAKDKNKWGVSIACNKEKMLLGYFDNEVEAAKVYDKAARKYHKEFAYLNFP